MTDFNNFNYREINATQSSFIGFVSTAEKAILTIWSG